MRLRKNVSDREQRQGGLTIFYCRDVRSGWNWNRDAATIFQKLICWRRVRRFSQPVFGDCCGNGCFDLKFCAEA